MGRFPVFMLRSLLIGWIWFGFAPSFVGVALGQIKVDPELKPYSFREKGISGKIQSVGSDTMNSLMLLWAARFKEGYASVHFEVDGAGSSKAIPALIAGADFGPMSREMKESEIRDFEVRYDYSPTLIPTSIDLVAVLVHRDNPLQSLSVQELDAIFSSTRVSGGKRSVTSWGQIRGEGDFEKAPISIFGRNAASGTYGFFKERILANGDFKDTVSEQPGATSVVQAVGSNRFAIGYSGAGHKTESVRVVPLSTSENSKAVSPTYENIFRGDYPLARFLYLTVNLDPNNKRLDPLRKEFIKFVLSQDGQEIVASEGYFPLDAQFARATLVGLGIQPDF